ncbi:11998_t:CDS:2 [Gigaspora rosea]|nr:11998_t:CDS:2 [Gigaspora rosea]
MITEWMIRINNPNLVGGLARMRLKDAQLLLKSTKDFEKGTKALCKLNLWYVEQIITRQDNTMLTWQQIKRIKEVYTQLEEINESQIKPKKEWVIGQRKNNM